MVKMVKYCCALGLILAFAAPAFAQDDYPVFQIAPGYGNIGFRFDFRDPNLAPFVNLKPGRHSGFVLDTNFNFNARFGVDLFTGYYSVAPNSTLYTNTFGMTASLRKSSRIIPYGTAGFGFGSLQLSTQLGVLGEKSMATRIGGGVDIPFNDSMAIRVDVTRMGFHFEKKWNSAANYSVGVVLNLSQ